MFWSLLTGDIVASHKHIASRDAGSDVRDGGDGAPISRYKENQMIPVVEGGWTPNGKCYSHFIFTLSLIEYPISDFLLLYSFLINKNLPGMKFALGDHNGRMIMLGTGATSEKSRDAMSNNGGGNNDGNNSSNFPMVVTTTTGMDVVPREQYFARDYSELRYDEELWCVDAEIGAPTWLLHPQTTNMLIKYSGDVHDKQPLPYGPLVEDIVRSQAKGDSHNQKMSIDNIRKIRVTSHGPTQLTEDEIISSKDWLISAQRELSDYVRCSNLRSRRQDLSAQYHKSSTTPQPFSDRLANHFVIGSGGGGGRGSGGGTSSPMVSRQNSAVGGNNSTRKRKKTISQNGRAFGARFASLANIVSRSNNNSRKRRRNALDDDDDDDDDFIPGFVGGSGVSGGVGDTGGVQYIEDDPNEIFPSEDDDDSDFPDVRTRYRDTSEESDVSSSEDDLDDSDFEIASSRRSRRAANRNSRKRTSATRSRSFRGRGNGRRLNDDEENVEPANVRRSHRRLGREKKSYREIEEDDGEAFEEEEEWEDAKDISGRHVSEMSKEDLENFGHLTKRKWLLGDVPSSKNNPLLYVPQLGDDVIYLPMLHELYLTQFPSP